MFLRRIIGLCLLLAMVTGIIGLAVVRGRQSVPAASGTVHVYATFYPLYEFSKQVGGSAVSVTNITPAGAEPHDFEPSPLVLARANEAAVFVYNGGTMEPWVGNFLQSYRHIAVKASTGIRLRAGTAEDGTPAAGTSDPHFWLDPVDAQTVVGSVRDGLITADPADAATFRRNAAAYITQLRQLDADYKQGLQSCKTRTIVTSHAAFGYLAARYDLQVVAIAGVSPDQEPDAARLAAISRLVRERGITTIFFEKLASPRLAATIASETGAKTAVFDPLEGLDDAAQKNGQTYISVQRTNLGALRAALSCR